jgi:hypothetical protein|tara:strand:- start:844 stop:1020 length:177 start_codon:yes stop_codon:yes gene_type:complete
MVVAGVIVYPQVIEACLTTEEFKIELVRYVPNTEFVVDRQFRTKCALVHQLMGRNWLA